MTRKDDAPTFIVAVARQGGPFHLSEDGDYTLCGWAIRSYWTCHEERVPVFTIRLSGETLCRQCENIAKEATP